MEMENGIGDHDDIRYKDINLQYRNDLMNDLSSVRENDSRHAINNNNTQTYTTPVISNKTQHILIVTTWRSGGTFLGDLLNHHPGVFYSFEPTSKDVEEKLMTARSTKSIQEEYIELISQVLKCKPQTGYIKYLKKVDRGNTYRFRQNVRMLNACKPFWKTCFLPEYYFKSCPLFPIQLLKTTLLRVQTSLELFNDSVLAKSLKLVVLFRDPRGMMNSRKNLGWCVTRAYCHYPKLVCDDMQDDVLYAHKAKDLFPGNMNII